MSTNCWTLDIVDGKVKSWASLKKKHLDNSLIIKAFGVLYETLDMTEVSSIIFLLTSTYYFWSYKNMNVEYMMCLCRSIFKVIISGFFNNILKKKSLNHSIVFKKFVKAVQQNMVLFLLFNTFLLNDLYEFIKYKYS